MSGYIGVLDSGVGGLSVVKEIKRLMPDQAICYIGDTKRCPYGDRPREEIVHYTMEMAECLVSAGKLTALVVACNTATAVALPLLKERFSIPVLGVIEPGAFMAAQVTKNGKVAVLATSRTIEGRYYDRAVKRWDDAIKVEGYACPWLAPLVEKGIGIEQELEYALRAYLEPAKQSGADTVLLGCTHYPLVEKEIASFFGPFVQLVNPALQTAREVRAVVGGKVSWGLEDLYLVTGDKGVFDRIASRALQTTVRCKDVQLEPALLQ